MRRRLGMDIPESYKLFILVNNISRYFPDNNPAKNTFHQYKTAAMIPGLTGR